MSLPQPIPDNPTRWEGWRNYNSPDLYQRLGLSFDANPTPEQIEENCRQLLVWWQKKLPLKNQPSNPVAQMLRAGLDEAPAFLAEARTKLLDPVARAELDTAMREKIVEDAIAEFKKILPYAISNQQITSDAEERLFEGAQRLGLQREEVQAILDVELTRLGVVRVSAAPPPPPAAPVAAAASPAAPAGVGQRDPYEEFRRVLQHSRLCLDGEEMTDDQRDAMCNIGESLGLTGGQAEDLIDEYLEEMANTPRPAAAATGPVVRPARPTPAPVAPPRPATPVPQRPAPATAPSRPAEPATVRSAAPTVNTSPMARLQERQKYPNFTTRQGIEMMLVTSGQFTMGSDGPEAAPHEQPTVPATVSCFYMARFPVTNAQFELFDPAHVNRRPPWADDRHPVVYVNSKEAQSYCTWLSQREGRKFRLPTEAEWEYAARGTDGRIFPWGARLDAGHYANFADVRTNFPWRDQRIDDGFAESAPVGSYPRGASPFGVEDMAGNVFEWCSDWFDAYKPNTNRTNPKGPASGNKRVYRGGSWKSRLASLRTTARAFNIPEYVSNDVGFRVACECE